MTSSRTYRTKSGRIMTQADIDAIADEVASTDFDIEVDAEAFDKLATSVDWPAEADPDLIVLVNEAGATRRFRRCR